MSDKLVSSSELARQTGLSKQAISKAIQRGELIPDETTKSGRALFELEKAKKIIGARSLVNEAQSRHEGLPTALKGGRPRLSPVDKNQTEKTSTDEVEDSEQLDDQRRFVKAKAMRAEILAEQAQMELDKSKGLLVSVEEVKKQGADLGAIIMTDLIALPDRLSSELSTMNDPHEIHQMLTDEINKMVKVVRTKLKLGAAE
ncbi:hypothetical protein I2492_09445 [Budviciaceae bacterium CWB-B4]|uniref:Uncharacterized protein n=1 Tax=Limnobaculum xujianqingii TaxID=2738837 RepID=A0A9D7AIB1_9GAMM|nr:hypothetical protein [Limnobaculum xujianqingii]MBK5073239.1 hypothetical protein [Limnobaculum xujianqingii]MBK5176548.1 hypothetical protein [Limnobaculum xujianqingii]